MELRTGFYPGLGGPQFGRRVTAMESGKVPADDCEIFFETSGVGPALLFIHAGVADSRMWDRQSAFTGFQAIRFDMRGFGRSGMGSTPYTNHEDALRVLDHLNVDRAVIVGCSTGAATALQLAETSPERIAGLALVRADPPGFDPGMDYQSPEWPDAVEAFKTGDLRRVAQLDAEMWLAGRDRSIASLDIDLVELFIDMDLTALANEDRRNELDLTQPLSLDSPPWTLKP